MQYHHEILNLVVVRNPQEKGASNPVSCLDARFSLIVQGKDEERKPAGYTLLAHGFQTIIILQAACCSIEWLEVDSEVVGNASFDIILL